MLPVNRQFSIEWEKILIPFFVLMLVTLAYYNMVVLEKARPGRILEKTLQNMELNFNQMKINIQERGQGYKVSFRGDIAGEDIFFGEIPDYRLEIYKHTSGELFIKDLKDGCWKRASELGLESLEDFFISPFKLLTLWSHLFKEAKFVHYQGGEEKVVLLNVPPQDLEKAGFLASLSDEKPFSLECLIFIEEEQFFIKQIIFSLYDNNNLHSILNRVFTFTAYEIKEPRTIPSLNKLDNQEACFTTGRL